MRYMIMLSDDESDEVAAMELASVAAFASWSAEMEARGVFRGGERLRRSTEATTVAVRGRDVLISDGPFAETKDQIGGYRLIECADLDEAIEIVSKHPIARMGRIEIRPVWEG
jgi:hypothetical protein